MPFIDDKNTTNNRQGRHNGPLDGPFEGKVDVMSWHDHTPRIDHIPMPSPEQQKQIPEPQKQIIVRSDAQDHEQQIALFGARAGYELQSDLEFLSNRALEPNIFFSGSFLAPAMPRLDERQVRLLTMRDHSTTYAPMRLLMPFSIEKPGFGVGPSIMRIWSNIFGPLGTPLCDRAQANATINIFLKGITNPDLDLPDILVFPDMRLDGPFANLLRGVALANNLPLQETDQTERPVLESDLDGLAYLEQSISKHHLRELNRQKRRLADLGDLDYSVSRQQADIRLALEDFLHLENKGWKGKKRTSLVSDRRRAAFVREAISTMSGFDRVRIHALKLDGTTIASLIVFVMGGQAYTWKTTYDENYAAFSPGKLLMKEVTQWQLDDFNIISTDSLADEDHPIMSRFWKERVRMGTVIVGTSEHRDRDVRQVTAQLDIYSSSRSLAKKLRAKVLAMARNKL